MSAFMASSLRSNPKDSAFCMPGDSSSAAAADAAWAAESSIPSAFALIPGTMWTKLHASAYLHQPALAKNWQVSRVSLFVLRGLLLGSDPGKCEYLQLSPY
eukprot:Skav224366  [mRNA]  locus=scaffold5095:96966:97268:- [translate_table: standard]